MTRDRHSLYREAGAQFAPAVARLARSYERDPDRARDLEQDIHFALWESFARFDGRCALKTWVYRVSHNVAADHRMKAMRGMKPVSLDHLDALPAGETASHDERDALDRARALIHRMTTLDAQVMLLWLEGESAAEIASVTGLGAPAVSTRIHRLKALIATTLNTDPVQGDTA